MSSKRSFSTPAAAVIGGNDDLLIEILLFLPAKSLFRFKLVSKQWRSLIFAPSFRSRHTLHHPRRRPEFQPLFFLGSLSSKYVVYNPTIRRFFPFTFPFEFSKVQILQSCNGLLLRSSAKEEDCYYVFNPTTKQQRELSSLPCGSVDSLYLMFDPSLSPHYRVVCFAKKNKKGTLIYVYDSETHKWKLRGERKRRASRFRNGIYFNGGIYFIKSGSSSSRFDPENIESRIPNPPLGLGKREYAMESNGFLVCLSLAWKEGRKILDVWEMKENENIWRNKYQAIMNPILATSDERSCYSLSLLGVIRGEEEQDSLLLLSLNDKILIYKFHDDVFEVDDNTSQEFLKEKPGWFVAAAHHFIHTLAPV